VEPAHIEASRYRRACRKLRTDFESTVGYPDLNFPLGQGSEIKAKHVAKGVGWWKNNEKRNNFRDLVSDRYCWCRIRRCSR
jgi:hypothetical protein